MATTNTPGPIAIGIGPRPLDTAVPGPIKTWQVTTGTGTDPASGSVVRVVKIAASQASTL